MSKKSYKVIAPDRYLRVGAASVQARVTRNDACVASSEDARLLFEGDRDAVPYLPQADMAVGRHVSRSKRYHCRWKGDAVFFDLDVDGVRYENAAWAYPDAPDSIASIRDRIAFEPTMLDIVVTAEPEARSA